MCHEYDGTGGIRSRDPGIALETAFSHQNIDILLTVVKTSTRKQTPQYTQEYFIPRL